MAWLTISLGYRRARPTHRSQAKPTGGKNANFAQTGGGDTLVGNPVLLQTLTAAVVGGTLLGGALLLTALLTLLAGTTLPHAVRDIIFGLVVLGAVLALRERSA